MLPACQNDYGIYPFPWIYWRTKGQIFTEAKLRSMPRWQSHQHSRVFKCVPERKMGESALFISLSGEWFRRPEKAELVAAAVLLKSRITFAGDWVFACDVLEVQLQILGDALLIQMCHLMFPLFSLLNSYVDWFLQHSCYFSVFFQGKGKLCDLFIALQWWFCCFIIWNVKLWISTAKASTNSWNPSYLDSHLPEICMSSYVVLLLPQLRDKILANI